MSIQSIKRQIAAICEKVGGSLPYDTDHMPDDPKELVTYLKDLEDSTEYLMEEIRIQRMNLQEDINK